ncbi:MAG: hypothetical protein EBZ61_06805 [Micrococcales bacterium]|nr:hypothetical protein [Micrococcales bacterium]
MYLGYDEHGNIVTKDPSGERGECVRPLLGSGQMTQEEYLGSLKKIKKLKQKAAEEAARRQAAEVEKAHRAIEQRNKAIAAAQKSAEYLKKMKFAKSGRMYSGLGGVMGNGLTPHHVSGEEIANTFRSNYGLSGADFGRGQMGLSFTTDSTKKIILDTYQELLRVEKGLKDMTDALSILEKAGKKSTPTYVNLKKLYDIAYNRYQNTPVTYEGKKYGSRRQAAIELGMKLRDAVAKKDSEGAKNLSLMFAAPLVYEQQVKAGQIKAFSGYGFGSEFDDDGMGFIPLLGLAAWQVAAAVLGTAAVSGAAYAVLSKDKVLDDALSDSKNLIAQALKEGKTELATQLIKREETLLKQKEKQSEGIVEKTEKLVGVAGTGTKIAAGIVALIVFWKIGLPLLQAKTAAKVAA